MRRQRRARQPIANSQSGAVSSHWFADVFRAKGIQPRIPDNRLRNEPVRYEKCRYRRRCSIKIMVGRPKDLRGVATRYDRCPIAFFSAIALSATIIF